MIDTYIYSILDGKINGSRIVLMSYYGIYTKLKDGTKG